MKKYVKSNFIQNGYLSGEKKTVNSFIETHFHDFFELEFIISGQGEYTLDGTPYSIKPGDLFFLAPMNFHLIDMRNAELFNIMFSGDICNQTFLQNLISNCPIFINTEGETKLYFESILNELCKNMDDREFSVALLNAIIAKLAKKTSTAKHSNELSIINKAELFILNNFRSEIKLDDVANYVALSSSYFSRLFKAEKGINFKTYLNNMRFEYAKKLIMYSDMSIMQICKECGFNDYPNFIRRFKQHTGFYPLEYKNRTILGIQNASQSYQKAND